MKIRSLSGFIKRCTANKGFLSFMGNLHSYQILCLMDFIIWRFCRLGRPLRIQEHDLWKDLCSSINGGDFPILTIVQRVTRRLEKNSHIFNKYLV